MEKPPAVACKSCSRTWNSASMAEGLRLLGHCPRCHGELSFNQPTVETTPLAELSQGDAAAIAPHLILGMPQRH